MAIATSAYKSAVGSMAVGLDCVDNMAVDERWGGARRVQAVRTHDAVGDSTRTRQ